MKILFYYLEIIVTYLFMPVGLLFIAIILGWSYLLDKIDELRTKPD